MTLRRLLGYAALVIGALRVVGPLAAQGLPTKPAIDGRTLVDSTRRALPPGEAYRRGFIALRDAGVDRFAAAHPTWDGRGVLIAILDSGIDPSVAGLQTTSTGEAKILDLRDFSREGRIALQPITRRGDTLLIGPRHLRGAASVAAIAGAGKIWGGTVAELRLGKQPAADIDGNGSLGDTLAVVVVHTANGWALFIDSQEDGTLANDHAILDYATSQTAFGWNAGGHPTAVSLAANLADSAGTPQLDLYFDTSSHGTHVSGIAAGHGLYGVTGFDGVAPGAKLIGLKISNDAQSGITVTGSIVRALDYAITFARARQLPLVVNLSFGVGNEIEGTARIDALVDSILAAHPEVVMTVAASNDGPGLSTAGFPGSASRVLSIGATEPRVFTGAAPNDTAASPLATFSSRGGELAAPDLVVPGVAYSTVPNFAVGEEQESGTSMAAPYAAGLVARLLSAAAASQRTVVAFQVAQALRRSAHPVIATSAVEAGVGTPDLSLAWQWLADQHAMPTLAVDVGQVRGRGAIFLVQPPAGDARLPTSIPVGQPRRVAVTVRRLDASTPLTLRLKASAEWLHLPATVTTTDGAASFEASIDPTALLKPGAYLASIAVTTDDAALGTVATIPVTVVVPISARAMLVTDTLAVPVGGTTRFFIPADSGRGLQLDVVTRRPGAQVMAMLHEPFGMPFRDGAAAPAGFGDAAAHYDLSAEDAVAGVYELDLVAPPGTAEEAIVTVRRAPIRLDGLFAKDTLHVFATNVASSSVSLRLRAGLIGAERVIKVDQPNDMPLRLAIPVPAWATRMIVDARMPRTVWSRYTDFGVTIEERGGLQLEATPLNYAFGRSGVEVPPTARGDSLIVLLAPGFADPSGSHAWALELRVRFYVDKPFMLDEGGAPPRLLGVSAARDERFGITRWPVTGPAGFDPLLILVALEGDNHIWTRQLRLAVDGGVPK